MKALGSGRSDTSAREHDPDKERRGDQEDAGQHQRRGHRLAASEARFVVLGFYALRPHNRGVTAISCVAIGIAFLLAVALLLFAGVLIGWVIPWLLERSRSRSHEPPRNTD